MENFWNKES